jgi:hypothetical protein
VSASLSQRLNTFSLGWSIPQPGRVARLPRHRAQPQRARGLEPALGWHDLDTYADDLAELIEALDLHDVGLTPPLARARFTPLGYRIDRDRPRRAFARA